MNVARPIKKEEYIAFRSELYDMSSGSEGRCQFTVGLDADPTLQPKNMTEKMAEVQGCKDRVVVILNRAVLNEMYWKSVVKRVEAKVSSEMAKAFLDPCMKELKNQELRTGKATSMAETVVLDTLFGGKGTFDEQMAIIRKNHQDAIAFLSEVKNIYENLGDAAVALAVQLKSVMVNAKVYGDPSGSEDQIPQTMTVGR